MNYKLSPHFTFVSRGVYHDTSSKGNGKRHDIYRATAIINGRRVRKRFADREEAKTWLRRKGGAK